MKCSIMSITYLMIGLISQIVYAGEARELIITQNFLNLPVSHEAPQVRLQIRTDGQLFRVFDIQLAERDPQYWAFVDVSELKGKSISLSLKDYEKKHMGIVEIYQDAF